MRRILNSTLPLKQLSVAGKSPVKSCCQMPTWGVKVGRQTSPVASTSSMAQVTGAGGSPAHLDTLPADNAPVPRLNSVSRKDQHVL